MYKNVHYVCMVHCMIKPRPDLESTHQASCFDIKNIYVQQIEVVHFISIYRYL